MAQRLALILVFASHLLVSGVVSKNITIENKCDYTVWPGIYTSIGQNPTTTGFALKKGEVRSIETLYYWSGIIWGRTLCSIDSTGNFSCATGDCGSGEINCSSDYPRTATTLTEFRSNNEGIESYRVNIFYGFNLPLLVVPKREVMSDQCTVVGCDVVDLNQACPYKYMVFDNEERPIACDNNGLMSSSFLYFKSACPTATENSYDNDFACPDSTDYDITFCPSITPNPTRVVPKSHQKFTKGAKNSSPLKLNVILGVSAALVVVIIIGATTTMVVVKAKNARRKGDLDSENIEDVVLLKRYSYAKIKKMTNSFAHILGRGGFGTVYKGNLLDESGRNVAVKILKELNRNGDGFINEVASMSRTSHVNIVSLLGFCYEGSKRALIYEYMPNGSLDKFISPTMSTKINWKALYNIAEGIARGLEYLHNRCVSRIVHFDIKPQNILMDENFCPRISDFGLAKLCKKKESIMSMLDARGTIGYVAPEVFSRNFGGVSHKSDVYSYGMVILEIIGARNRENFENSRSNSSSMYFPEWIYKDLKREETMRLLGEQLTEEEYMIVTKMVLVGLWCIQTNPFDRPPMSKVVEMLEGSLEDLHIPPKPLLGLPAIMVSETVEESQDISSFSIPSQLKSQDIQASLSPPRYSKSLGNLF